MANGRVLRAMSDDGGFRVITVDTSSMVFEAAETQKLSDPEARVLFSELLTAAVLVRETLSPDMRVQCILQGEDRKSRMIADAHPQGLTRGLVQIGSGKSLQLGESATLQVQRTVQGAVNQGIVSAHKGSGVSGAVMEYMQGSEQVTSMVSLGTRTLSGNVIAAGGYVVQVLPEIEAGPLMVMTERLKEFQDFTALLEKDLAGPDELLAELLYGMPFTKVSEGLLKFGCQCSEERMFASLATLSKADIRDLMQPGNVLEIECDFCGKEYRIQPERLRGLLEDN